MKSTLYRRSVNYINSIIVLKRHRILSHISLSSFIWDISKQKNPRCDAAKRGVPSGAIQFADGLIQMIGMGKHIRHKWVKCIKKKNQPEVTGDIALT